MNMNHHQRACNSCQLAIKAYQNLVGSHSAFERLVALLPAGDHLLLSSVFCFAVVKYAKPFIETETPFGKTKYPSRHLKKVEGFSTSVPSPAMLSEGTPWLPSLPRPVTRPVYSGQKRKHHPAFMSRVPCQHAYMPSRESTPRPYLDTSRPT